MKRWRLLLLLLLAPVPMQTWAQEALTWQQVWQDVLEARADAEEGGDEAAWEDDYEVLEQLAEHPIDLNRATREELEQLPFLSAQQVMDLREYLDRYGPMRSLGELRMVRSLDYLSLRLLPFFVTAGLVEERSHFPSLDTLVHRARHTLTLSGRVPCYTRKGDDNGYLGYRYRHELRYEMAYGDNARLGLLGAQDAGEPFLSDGNRWGYDHYSFYVQVRQLGRLTNLVAGRYRAQTGMGLVLGSSFSLGKQAALQSLGRRPSVLRPYTSRSVADYMQGVGATIQLNRRLSLSGFLSYRSLDATLDTLGRAATIVTTGYHRTPTELAKKHNTDEATLGTALDLQLGPLRLGLTALYQHLNRRLEPDTRQLYRRYYASGQDFAQASLSYACVLHRFSLSGETATDRHGHLATVNALAYQPADGWSLMALGRYYSYRYEALRAHAVSEGGRVQNESGLLLGATWQPLHRWQLQAYADYAHFAWARYLASKPSDALDLVTSTVLETGRWTLKGRYRWHRRERDNTAKTALLPQTTHRLRLSGTWVPASGWSLTTQADGARAVFKQAEQGWMLSETCAWQPKRWLVQCCGAYFRTDSYAARLYLYERQLEHTYGFPSYYGEGMHVSLLLRADCSKCLRIGARAGYTHYFDRAAIGSGLQRIGHSSMTDVDLQLRLRL